MTLLYIEYSSVNDLIESFENIDDCDRNSEYFWLNLDKYNFVLVNPKLYYGSYGGLIRNNILSLSRYRQYSHISYSLSDNISFIWWDLSEPPLVGTLLISKQDGRVLIPKEMYLKLTKKSSLSQVGKSSYYM